MSSQPVTLPNKPRYVTCEKSKETSTIVMKAKIDNRAGSSWISFVATMRHVPKIVANSTWVHHRLSKEVLIVYAMFTLRSPLGRLPLP